MIRHICASLAVFLGVALIPVSLASAGFALASGGTPGVRAEGQATGDPSILSSEEALSQDVQEMAKIFGIPPQEAARQLQLQDGYDKIDYERDDPFFAAMNTHLGTPFSAQYLSASSEHWGAVREQLIDLGLEPYTTFRLVPASLVDLTAAQDIVNQSFKEPADLHLDLQNASVVIDVTRLPSIDERSTISEAVRQTYPNISVAWNLVPGLIRPAGTGGGGAMTTCTAGFVVSVYGPSTNRGISTAGHCPADQIYLGMSLNYREGAERDHADVQWHDYPNVGWSPTFLASGGDNRYVTTLRYYGEMDNGDFVCSRGKTTGYHCGYISDTTICPSYILSCDATFVRVHSADEDLSDPGDSGGPVFLANTAYGLTSGEFEPGNDMLYMPQQYTDAAGVFVLTQ